MQFDKIICFLEASSIHLVPVFLHLTEGSAPALSGHRGLVFLGSVVLLGTFSNLSKFEIEVCFYVWRKLLRGGEGQVRVPEREQIIKVYKNQAHSDLTRINCSERNLEEIGWRLGKQSLVFHGLIPSGKG